MAPKSYYLELEEGFILKQKGPSKAFVTSGWFREQYSNPSLTQLVTFSSLFLVLFDLILNLKVITYSLHYRLTPKSKNLYFFRDMDFLLYLRDKKGPLSSNICFLMLSSSPSIAYDSYFYSSPSYLVL